MRVMVCADNHEVDFRVGEELISRPVMLCIWIVDCAMLATLHLGPFRRSFRSLEESVHVQVRVWEYEGKVEGLGGEAVACEADIEWCHDGWGNF